jgi:hypothetical protein
MALLDDEDGRYGAWPDYVFLLSSQCIHSLLLSAGKGVVAWMSLNFHTLIHGGGIMVIWGLMILIVKLCIAT